MFICPQHWSTLWVGGAGCRLHSGFKLLSGPGLLHVSLHSSWSLLLGHVFLMITDCTWTKMGIWCLQLWLWTDGNTVIFANILVSTSHVNMKVAGERKSDGKNTHFAQEGVVVFVEQSEVLLLEIHCWFSLHYFTIQFSSVQCSRSVVSNAEAETPILWLPHAKSWLILPLSISIWRHWSFW